MSYISAERKGDDVIIWERTENGREMLTRRAPFYFFVDDKNGEFKSIHGDSLKKIVAKTYNEYQQLRQQYKQSGYTLFESDLPPELKYLSQHYYQTPAPTLNVTFLDIEVDYDLEVGFASVENPYAPINSISMYHTWSNRMVVYAIPPSEGWTDERLLSEMENTEKFPNDVIVEAYLVSNEREMLLSILGEIENSDVVSGWNSDWFDIPYIAKRIERTLGQKYFRQLSFPHATAPKYKEVERFGRSNTTIELGGRISCDYLELFKKYEMAERPSYKLESIADEILPELPKLNYEGNLHSLYRNDFAWFCRYNIRDTEILKGFEEKLGYVALANEMYHLSTGVWKHVGGTLKLAELAINNYCVHELNLRFPDMPDNSGSNGGGIAGAYVLEPKSGMHDWIGSIDINSLYPSAIRSINISPETIIGQFVGETKSAQAIAEGLMTPVELIYEDQSSEEHLADEWREILLQRKWSISGYGTVFTQTKQGIIPSILEDWYSTRTVYQKKKNEAKDKTLKAYFNRLQYVYKIKLNSLYGALTNAFFRYYDLRLGESTTATGRAILRHQCAKTNEVLCGEYDYQGQCVLYGDTDSTYFSLNAENQEEAIQIANAAALLVNRSFAPFMRKTFLCQPAFDNKIKAGREIVASRGIFVEKKRYILRVIDNEGEVVDKLKVMGLDTKKTTIPPSVGKKLNDFIGRLLRGEEWDSIARDIVDYKEWIKTTTSILEIGLPKGVQKVEAYTKEWKRDPSTRLPGHVAAAIHYNALLEKYADKESLPIMSGMKIKVFYLTQKYGRFHSVAIPTDIEQVPDWFLTNFTIDREKHVKRLIDKPLGNIIKAIGKEVPTAQSLAVDDLLSF